LDSGHTKAGNVYVLIPEVDQSITSHAEAVSTNTLMGSYAQPKLLEMNHKFYLVMFGVPECANINPRHVKLQLYILRVLMTFKFYFHNSRI